MNLFPVDRARYGVVAIRGAGACVLVQPAISGERARANEKGLSIKLKAMRCDVCTSERMTENKMRRARVRAPQRGRQQRDARNRDGNCSDRLSRQGSAAAAAAPERTRGWGAKLTSHHPRPVPRRRCTGAPPSRRRRPARPVLFGRASPRIPCPCFWACVPPPRLRRRHFRP